MDKKQLAQHLYMTQGKTQKEIALEVGVSERTIYTWIHQYAWDKLKQAAYQAPATISNNLCCQLIEMQNAIAAREPGHRFPDQKEAEVIRKLVLSIETMKKYPSLSQNMQMIESFRNYVRPLNTQFTKQLAHYSERFLTEKSIGGFAPYQMEYGIEQLAPIAPFYDELEGEEPCDKDNPPAYRTPCTHMDNCLHPGDCTYPKCKFDTLLNDGPQIKTPSPSEACPGLQSERGGVRLPSPVPNAYAPVHTPSDVTSPSPSERVGVRLPSPEPVLSNAEGEGVGVRLPSPKPVLSDAEGPVLSNAERERGGVRPLPEETGSNPAIPPIEDSKNNETSAPPQPHEKTQQIVPPSNPVTGSLPRIGPSGENKTVLRPTG